MCEWSRLQRKLWKEVQRELWKEAASKSDLTGHGRVAADRSEAAQNQNVPGILPVKSDTLMGVKRDAVRELSLHP